MGASVHHTYPPLLKSGHGCGSRDIARHVYLIMRYGSKRVIPLATTTPSPRNPATLALYTPTTVYDIKRRKRNPSPRIFFPKLSLVVSGNVKNEFFEHGMWRFININIICTRIFGYSSYRFYHQNMLIYPKGKRFKWIKPKLWFHDYDKNFFF